ncbi:MAG: hypothetical protein WC346_00135 [Methanogenium sp.]|jgi:hypothetical protein
MSCIRANIDITIVEGGTFDKTFQWKTGDPAVAVDLTGYTAKMQVRAKLKDASPLIDIESSEDPWEADVKSGIFFYDDEYDPDDAGKWRIYITDEDAADICSAHKDITGVYDCFLYNPDGEAVLQLYGVATLVAAVTREET